MRTADEPILFDHPIALTDLDTPCLLLDEARVRRNAERLRTRLAALGVRLRPHLKTAKSADVARLVMEGPHGPATVSTLKEAEYFAAHGVTDLIYAVGIAPNKLARVAALRARGVDLAVVLDSVEAAQAVAAKSRAIAGASAGASGGAGGGDRGHIGSSARDDRGERDDSANGDDSASGDGDAAPRTRRRTASAIPALIEIDCDGHRSGVQPHETARLLAIARTLVEGGAALRGIITHAGESYNCRGLEALQRMAEQERAAAVHCATVLRQAGLPCPIVSVGSTPTAHAAASLEGVTEVRAGVFTFFDLVMAGVGVCGPEDIALSVLATVIGHQPAKGWIIVDAGWMALSRDRGTSRWSSAIGSAAAGADDTEADAATGAPAGRAASGDRRHGATDDAPGFARDQGYGLVCDLDGRLYGGLIVKDANQEHGILACRGGSGDGGGGALPDLPLGAMVRILPNHACATAAQHDRYRVLTQDGRAVGAEWPRINGW